MSLKKSLTTLAASASGFVTWVTIAAAAAAATTVPTGLSGSRTNLTSIGSGAGLTSNAATDLPTLIGKIINVILGLLGIVFIILIIYSGVQFMLARGDKTKVENATGNIRTAIIGLVITVAAYAISNYVVGALVTATA